MDSTTALRDIKVSASMRLTLPFKGKQTEVKGFNVIVGDSPINGENDKMRCAHFKQRACCQCALFIRKSP